MMRVPAEDRLAQALVTAIKGGDHEALAALLAQHPGLAGGLVMEDGGGRTPLHLLADAPGGRPRQRETVRLLVEAGAELNAQAVGMWHEETPLHWAASNDDVELIDALLDAGADIEHPGSSISGGPPIDSALGYGQFAAVRRLFERGARVRLGHLVALGETERVRALLATAEPEERDGALWNACRRGDVVLVRLLVEHGADPDWAAPWSGQTPLDVAREQRQHHLLAPEGPLRTV